MLGFSNMRKGEANLEKLAPDLVKRRDNVSEKVHPALFAFLKLNKEIAEAQRSLGPNPPMELVNRIEDRFEWRTIEIFVQYSGCAQPAENQFPAQTIFSSTALESVSDAQGVAEYIHFNRHGTTLKSDAQKMQAGDYKASLRVQRTFGDYEALRCGRGPVKRFRGELQHNSIFQFGIGLGLECLTPEELAYLFDEHCPCGCVVKEGHSPDGLYRLRKRFLDRLKKANDQ
jgi:hypothetical protein